METQAGTQELEYVQINGTLWGANDPANCSQPGWFRALWGGARRIAGQGLSNWTKAKTMRTNMGQPHQQHATGAAATANRNRHTTTV
jgi:hypothetical protein